MSCLKRCLYALYLAALMVPPIGVVLAQEADTPDAKTPFAQLHVVPPHLSFKKLTLSSNPLPETGTLTITDTGAAPMTVTVVAPMGAGSAAYSITSGCGVMTLQPHGSKTVMVGFQPASEAKTFPAEIAISASSSSPIKGKSSRMVGLSGSAKGTRSTTPPPLVNSCVAPTPTATATPTLSPTPTSSATRTSSPSPTPSPKPTATPTSIATSTGTATPLATSTPTATATPIVTSKIFAANNCGSSVTSYPLSSSGDTATLSAVTGLAQPGGIARDSKGNLYVVNRCNATITVYSAGSNGSAAPIAVIGGTNTGMVDPFGIALDSNNNIYVSDFASGILVYSSGSNGNVAPTQTITGSNTTFSGPRGVKVDPSGRIYVADNQAKSILIFPAGSNGNVAPSVTISGSNTGLSGPFGLSLDSAENIYVAELQGNDVRIFSAAATGNATPTAIISGSNTGFTSPFDLAVNSHGDIYVAESGSIFSSANPADIRIFVAGNTGNTAPNTVIAGANTGLANSEGIALDPASNIFASNAAGGSSQRGSVTAYPAGSSGNAAPSATITNPSTGIDRPDYVALDSSGKIYVANNQNGPTSSVTVYPAGSNADVPPVATITCNGSCVLGSSASGLTSPGGVAVDNTGNIYVTNENTNVIAIFAAGSNGNLSPAATISGSNTGMGNPTGIALDSGGNIYVANNAAKTASITVYPAGSTGNVIPTSSFAPCSKRPFDVKVDGSGNIYVACAEGAINVFAPGASGAPTPIASISGSNTGMSTNTVSAIALDSARNIYVANSSNFTSNGFTGDSLGSILMFAAGSNGNVAPNATVTGPHTLLDAASGLAILQP